MPSADEDILNGIEPNEDALVEEMLRQDVSQVGAQKAAAPKVEVMPTAKLTKLLVHIPADNPRDIKVTRVEVRSDGSLVTLEAARSPTGAELALIRHGKREVLSGPDPQTTAVTTEKPKRPMWHWIAGGVAAVAVVGGGIYAVHALRSDEDFEEEEDAD